MSTSFPPERAGYAEPMTACSPIDGAPVVCRRYGHRPCECESCDPVRLQRKVEQARVNIMRAMLVLLPRNVGEAWVVPDDNGALVVRDNHGYPNRCRYFIGKARSTPRDGDVRLAQPALLLLADALERLLPAA